MRLGSIVLNVRDLKRGATFWTEALGYRLEGGRIPPGGCPVLVGGAEEELPITLDTNDRTHLDLHVDSVQEQEDEIERLIGLGARRVEWSYPRNANHVVLQDPEGNLFCVVNIGDA